MRQRHRTRPAILAASALLLASILATIAGTGQLAAQSAAATGSAGNVQLPKGFVHLDEVAPDIITEMRYATAQNFTGRKVPGYHANRCILARPVARALARVQKSLIKEGYSLKVYDCYRPARAVRAFFRWAQGRFGSPNKPYYPRISRSRIIPLGYIAKRSSHSRGTAVDLTLVRRSPDAEPTTASAASGTSAPASCIKHAPANLDMGTSWDCFDQLSHTQHRAISPAAKANRRRLLRAMQAEGFHNYKREWWHYSMSLRRFQKLHDFPVR